MKDGCIFLIGLNLAKCAYVVDAIIWRLNQQY